jgi:hypothetical protein
MGRGGFVISMVWLASNASVTQWVEAISVGETVTVFVHSTGSQDQSGDPDRNGGYDPQPCFASPECHPFGGLRYWMCKSKIPVPDDEGTALHRLT